MPSLSQSPVVQRDCKEPPVTHLGHLPAGKCQQGVIPGAGALIWQARASPWMGCSWSSTKGKGRQVHAGNRMAICLDSSWCGHFQWSWRVAEKEEQALYCLKASTGSAWGIWKPFFCFILTNKQTKLNSKIGRPEHSIHHYQQNVAQRPACQKDFAFAHFLLIPHSWIFQMLKISWY